MNRHLRTLVIGLIVFYPIVFLRAGGYWLDREGYMYTSNIVDPKLLLQRGYEPISSGDYQGYLHNDRLEDIRFSEPPIVFDRLRLIPLEDPKEDLKKEEKEVTQALVKKDKKPPKAKVVKPSDPRVVSAGGYPHNMPMLILEPQKTREEESVDIPEDTLLPEDVIGVFKQEKTKPSGKNNSIYVPFQMPQQYDSKPTNPFPAKATYISE